MQRSVGEFDYTEAAKMCTNVCTNVNARQRIIFVYVRYIHLQTFRFIVCACRGGLV